MCMLSNVGSKTARCRLHLGGCFCNLNVIALLVFLHCYMVVSGACHTDTAAIASYYMRTVQPLHAHCTLTCQRLLTGQFKCRCNAPCAKSFCLQHYLWRV